MKDNIIQFKNKNEIKTNLEEAVESTIKKCNIQEPKVKICEDCGKILEEDDIGGKSIEFIYGSTPKYWCKKCEALNNVISDFLFEYLRMVRGKDEDMSCDWFDFIAPKIKELLENEPPEKHIKYHPPIKVDLGDEDD